MQNSNIDNASTAAVYGRTTTQWAEEDGVRRARIVTTEPIARGETIEIAPVSPIYGAENSAAINAVEATAFTWVLADSTDERHPEQPVVVCALAHGLVGAYRHSARPTADVIRHLAEFRIEAVALRDLAAGDEVTLDYGMKAGDYRIGAVDQFLRPLAHPTLQKRHVGVWRKKWLTATEKERAAEAKRAANQQRRMLERALKATRQDIDRCDRDLRSVKLPTARLEVVQEHRTQLLTVAAELQQELEQLGERRPR